MRRHSAALSEATQLTPLQRELATQLREMLIADYRASYYDTDADPVNGEDAVVREVTDVRPDSVDE